VGSQPATAARGVDFEIVRADEAVERLKGLHSLALTVVQDRIKVTPEIELVSSRPVSKRIISARASWPFISRRRRRFNAASFHWLNDPIQQPFPLCSVRHRVPRALLGTVQF